jgi:hypothetical protein
MGDPRGATGRDAFLGPVGNPGGRAIPVAVSSRLRFGLGWASGLDGESAGIQRYSAFFDTRKTSSSVVMPRSDFSMPSSNITVMPVDTAARRMSVVAAP